MSALHFPWLEAAILVPLVGAIVVSRISVAEVARNWCLALAGLAFAFTAGSWIDFALLSIGEHPAPLAYVFPGQRVSCFAIDALTAPILLLTALVYLLTAIATLRTKVRRFSFTWTLLSLSIVLATLSCQVPWGIIALLAAATVPPYLELRARRKPTRVYVLHMALFVGLLLVGWWQLQSPAARHSPSLWAVVPLVVAVLIRSGIAPFHCWLTDLFEHASFGTALLYVTPMMGAFAAVKLALPIAPDGLLRGIGLLSLATAVYAAGMALVQREARRFFCYIFLSHSALVLVGLETVTPIGLTGALCVWLSVGLSLAGFGLVIRDLEARHGRLSLAGYHGVYEHTPLLAICFLVTGMASVGFPGTFGFLGTELLVDGAVQAFPYVGIAVVLAAALNGIALVQVYFRLFTGTRHVSSVPLEVGIRERLVVLTLAALILGGGLFPQPAVSSRHHAATALLEQRRAVYPPPVEVASQSLADAK